MFDVDTFNGQELGTPDGWQWAGGGGHGDHPPPGRRLRPPHLCAVRVVSSALWQQYCEFLTEKFQV